MPDEKLTFYIKRRIYNEPFIDPKVGGEAWIEKHFIVKVAQKDIDDRGIEDVFDNDVLEPILRVETTDRGDEMLELEGDRDLFDEIPEPFDMMLIADYVVIIYDDRETGKTGIIVNEINNEVVYRGEVKL